MKLIHIDNGIRVGGIITETEAYQGEADLACHARAGRTPRTVVMYGPPGHAYVYFTYGMHWLLNFVTEAENYPAAVLIRGINPTEGIQIIEKRREGRPPQEWTNGPAKVCQALGVDKRYDGADSCSSNAKLFIEEGEFIPDPSVTIGARVGLYTVPEPWKSMPWRFLYTDVLYLDG